MGRQGDLFSWMEAPHRGNLRPVHQKLGIAYIYRWTQNGENHSLWFPVGTPIELIHAKVLEIEGNLRESSIRIKMGLEQAFEEQNKGRMTLKELSAWYAGVAEEEHVSKRVIYLQKNAMARLMKFVGGDVSTKRVTREVLNDFKRELQRTNSDVGARSLLAKLAAVFKKGFYENKILFHPFVGFKFPTGKAHGAWPIMGPEEMAEVDGLFQSDEMLLAWRIARFTGLRPNSINGLLAEKISQTSIKFYVSKLDRWEEVLVHSNLRPYLEPLLGRKGKVFGYKYWGTINIGFGEKIKQFKGDDFRPSGGYTPRKSLGSYLRNVVSWRHEDIKLFLTHHKSDATWLYTNDQPERIRPLVEALPFR